MENPREKIELFIDSIWQDKWRFNDDIFVTKWELKEALEKMLEYLDYTLAGGKK